MHRRIFRENGDSPLPFEIARVHNALGHRLIFPVNTALPEHLVHERGLAVVNMRNDRNVSQIFSYHFVSTSIQSGAKRRFLRSNVLKFHVDNFIIIAHTL